MADQIFRREWDYLMNVFGTPDLGWYYPDYRDAVRNPTYNEIIGGTVYLVRQCPMRGLVLEKPVEFRQLQDGSGDTQFIGIEQAVTFKVSVSDLIKGGVLAADGSYALSDDPSTTAIEGVLNHKYIIYRGQLYEVLNFDRGVIFKGDPSNAYITCTRDVDYAALQGKAQLVIQDTPDTPPVETFTVTVDGVLYGTYLPGSTVVLTTPTKEGYTFKGWSSQEVSVTNNTFTMPSQTVVINSLWEKVENPDPGTYVVYVDEVFLGNYAPGTVVTLDTPTKQGYTFSGWQSDEVTISDNTFTMPESNVFVTSLWTAVPAPTGVYKVTVVNPCDNVDATQSGEYEIEPYQLEDGSWSEPSILIRAGSYYAMHNFSHWVVTSGSGTFGNANTQNTYFMPDTKETTIECVWEEVADPRHTVTFVGIDRAPEKYNTGAKVTIRAGIKDGYEFKRWNAVPTVSFSPNATTSYVQFTMPDSDVTITAVYVEVEYTVTFMVGTEVFATITTPPNTPIDVATPELDGYVFNEWQTSGGNTFNPADGVTNNLTVTAKFTGVPRTITFNSDGGSEVESITVENGKVLGQLPTPTKAGYDFIKWTFNGNEVYATTVVTQDMTLLAVWEEVSATAGEEDLIDLDSDYRLVFVNARFDFRKNSVYRTLGSGSDYTAEHFYTLKGGQATMPLDEYTTHFPQYGWPSVNGADGEFTQPRTFGDTDQTTRVVLYRRKTNNTIPGAVTEPAEVGIPTGFLSGTYLYGQVSVCCPNTSQSGNLPTDPSVTTNRLVCLTVVPTADGNFWRYEFGWVTGINSGNMLNQYSDWNNKHEGDTEIPLN